MFEVNQYEQDNLECPKIMVPKDFIIIKPLYIIPFWNPCDQESAIQLFSRCFNSIKFHFVNYNQGQIEDMFLQCTSLSKCLLTGNAFIFFNSIMSQLMYLEMTTLRKCLLTGNAFIVFNCCMSQLMFLQSISHSE